MPLYTINIHERSSRKCSKKVWARQLNIEIVTKPNPITSSSWAWQWRLWGSKHLVRSHMFNVIAKPMVVEERQHVSSPQNNPTIFLSLPTRLFQIWTKTTHFFNQVVKPITTLLTLQHTFKEILCLRPYFFLPITKSWEFSTTLFYI